MTSATDPRLTLPPIPEKLRHLECEITAFYRELPRLVSAGHEGRFALMKGDDVVGLWDTFGDCIQAGTNRFGKGNFAAQMIRAEDLCSLRTAPASDIVAAESNGR